MDVATRFYLLTKVTRSTKTRTETTSKTAKLQLNQQPKELTRTPNFEGLMKRDDGTETLFLNCWALTFYFTIMVIGKT